MSFLKKLPFGSLTLLLVTYSIFGWFLFSSTFSQTIWWLEFFLALLLPIVLTAPLTLLKMGFVRWLSNDTRYFIAVIFASLLGVVVLTWIRVFADILVLISAGALVRVDLQIAEFTKLQALLILMMVSWAGFSIGLLCHRLF